METISALLGYESEAAFRKAFKREIGMPPAQYAGWAKGSRAGNSSNPGARMAPHRNSRTDEPATRHLAT